MRIFFLLKTIAVSFILSLAVQGAAAAGVAKKKSKKMQRIENAFVSVQGYLQQQATQHTIAGMEAYASRKLTREEKLMLQLHSMGIMKQRPDTTGTAPITEKQLKKMRSMAITSLVLVGAGLITVFLLPILGVAMLVTGAVMGFIVRGQARQLKDNQSENIASIAGIAGIAGLVAVALIFLLTLLVIIAFTSGWG